VLETIRPILRAAAIAGFTVGTLLFLLNPPSLSGAGGLVTLIVASLAFILLCAWAFVAMLDRDAMPEDEFERLVVRTEELARSPKLATEATEFELLVADAIDRLPPEFQAVLEDVPVVVSRRGAEVHAYGRYYGDTISRDNFPDRIVLYQDTLERDFGFDSSLLRDQVERTLRHELAHHLGWNESGVQGLGL
jgi:predicted Zn-dependent protease with MMP-like domain